MSQPVLTRSSLAGARTVRRPVSSACLALAATTAFSVLVAIGAGAWAADDTGHVELIMSKLPPSDSAAYKRIRKAAGKATGHKLELTQCEVWVVPADRVEAVLREATARGANATRVSDGWNHLFRKMPTEAPMSLQQTEMMAMAKQSPATMGVGMMSSPPANMVEYALTKGMRDKDASATPATIVLPLDDKTSVTARRTAVHTTKEKCIWRGVIEDTGESVTLMWWPGGRMSGTVNYKGMMYVVRSMGGDAHAIVGMNPTMMPDEHGPMKPMRRDDPMMKEDPSVKMGDGSMMRPRSGPEPAMPTARPRPTDEEVRNAQDAAATARPTMSKKKGGGLVQTPGQPVKMAKPVEITVMVAYTKKAAAHYSDIKSDLIELAVEESNQTFRNSGIGHIGLKLVHTYMTDYVEEGGIHFDHVWRMADRGDGYMEEVHKLRDQKKADVVILVVDDPSGCGLATRVAADAEESFAVVHHGCAAATYSLAHEVGHIIGARHDRTLDQSTGPFPYGHGFVNGMKWRTMMSYKGGCNDCPRMPVWSSPSVKIQGEAAGAAMNNNARVLQEQAERVAKFR